MWIVDRHQGKQSPLTLVVAGVLLAVVFWAGMPQTRVSKGSADFKQVRAVVQTRCATCHAQTPTFAGMTAPPKGVLLETEAQIRAQSALILQQAVTTRVMPPGNLSGMTGRASINSALGKQSTVRK